ncbi:MAG: hypothetical protein E2598_02850 [Sphingobium sp.]|nr:hypothetical protein [Sphingobium sp.]
MKRRALVLTSENASHPFRRRLARHILLPLPDIVRRNDQDIKLFLMSFSAFFFAAYHLLF